MGSQKQVAMMPTITKAQTTVMDMMAENRSDALKYMSVSK